MSVLPPHLRLSQSDEDLIQKFKSLRTVDDVGALLELSYGHLGYILYKAPQRYPYKTFTVKKRKGGHRTISVPHPTVKILQSKLDHVLRLIYRPRASTHGFVEGRGILTNAERHVRKPFVLNIDLAEFFPSINFGRVRGMFMAAPFKLPPPVATVLAQLCCHEKKLPQGAPTSPIVSNMICSRLDGELQRLASRYRCVYTRYADDITISCMQNEFPRELAWIDSTGGHTVAMVGPNLKQIIEKNGFAINDSKTRLQFRTERQMVTGLTVNTYPNVPRRHLSQIRAMLHAFEKYGLEKAQQEFRSRWDHRSRRPSNIQPSFKQVLRGKLAFVGMVKGRGDRRYRNLRNALHALAPDLISRIQDPPDIVSRLPEPPQAVFWPSDPPQSKLEGPWSAWCEKYKKMVFQLEIITDSKIAGGTAFAWGPGVLATAAHNHGHIIRVYHRGNDKEGVEVHTFVAHPRAEEGRGIDAAILHLPAGILKKLEPFPFRKEPMNPGEEIAALGFPRIPGHHSGFSIFPGMVESVAPRYDGQSQSIQVSTEISGGMSGGPVIDRRGLLVGIVMEASTERADGDVPGRKFRHVLPVSYLLEIDTSL